MAVIYRNYEDWMKPQVAALFSNQYGVTPESFETLITSFYEHPFQLKKCIRIVATEGEKVVGFQSFFYWPYSYKNSLLNSYQSGNSLIHPDYRGQGLFQKLLEYAEGIAREMSVSMFVGFPIDASINSLIRNKWDHVTTLSWFVKPVSYIAPFFPFSEQKLKETFQLQKHSVDLPNDDFTLSNEKDFLNWRREYQDKVSYYNYSYEEKNGRISFDLKVNRRKKFITELIVGGIDGNYDNTELLKQAFQMLIKTSRSLHFISFISIAFNEANSTDLTDVLSQLRFKKLKNKIYFCVKDMSGVSPVYDKSKWRLFRRDVDTW